jgi:hypothetical protein
MRILVVVWVVMSFGVARAESPADVARKIVNAQLAALEQLDDSFEKTFAPGSVVNESDVQNLQMLKLDLANGGMTTSIDATKLVSLTAGGNAKVVWIAAEAELTTRSLTGQDDNGEPTYSAKENHAIRFTELAVADGTKWKVVAAQFARPGSPKRNKLPPSAIDNTTKADQLARIVISPSALSTGLAKDATAVVFGTDKAERGIGGQAGKKLLDRWKSLKLEIDGAVREVRTATFGFVQANVNWVQPGGAPYRMRVLMIATPDPTGTWTIRTVHYATP